MWPVVGHGCVASTRTRMDAQGQRPCRPGLQEAGSVDHPLVSGLMWAVGMAGRSEKRREDSDGGGGGTLASSLSRCGFVTQAPWVLLPTLSPPRRPPTAGAPPTAHPGSCSPLSSPSSTSSLVSSPPSPVECAPECHNQTKTPPPLCFHVICLQTVSMQTVRSTSQ